LFASSPTRNCVPLNLAPWLPRINNAIDCEVWGKSAELIVDKLKKGDSILVTGAVRRQEWNDKETGAKRSKHVLSIQRFEFMPRGAANTSEEPVF